MEEKQELINGIRKILENSGGKITGKPCLLNLDNRKYYGLEIFKNGSILFYYDKKFPQDSGIYYGGIRKRKLEGISKHTISMLYKSLKGEIKHYKKLTKGKKSIQLKMEL